MVKSEKVSPRLIQKVYKKYLHFFKSKPEMMVFAPGRVNLIGEHTDYSEGFVFPIAINMGIVIGFSPRDDDKLSLYSLDFDQYFDQKISDFEKGTINWDEYLKGVAWGLKKAGYKLKGLQGVFAGDLPIGAGLSSSAALEIAAAKSFCVASGIDMPKKVLAKICQKAEYEWVGVNVGIMDQLISATGRMGYALKLDCRTLETEYFSIPENICFVVMDTNTRRELSHSDYNTRHEEVRMAEDILGIRLRDASLSMLMKKKDQMPSVLYKRAKHVITENLRVHEFGLAMETNDLERMGDLLNESHRSLRDDYQVSSKELDIIVSSSQVQRGCYGARMTGAGFGGCALALIDKEKLDDFTKGLSRLYKERTGIKPDIFKVESNNGVYAFTYDG